METIIGVHDVCERDVDLLLLEEFVASADFRSWFLSQIGVETATTLSEARRSVWTDSGESDLELTFQMYGGEVKILVENKIYAPFQDNQLQRYLQRADDYRKGGECKEVVTVIIAPEAYFRSESDRYGFDAKVTYEAVYRWFSAADRTGLRTDYKLTLLRVATERGRTGWQLVPHTNVSQYWEKYWNLANDIAHQLSMPKPKNEIPAHSHFIVFRPAALPRNVKLKHKVGYGHVDLEFRGMGGRLAEMERLYGAVLPPGARIEKAAKSAVLRARVDAVDMRHADFAASEAAIRKGIETAALLLDWYVRVHP